MQIQVHGGDIYSKAYRLDFSTNINPFGMPESLKQAAIKGINASIHYPDVQCRELINAIAKKEEIPSDWIICGNGAAELLFSLVSAKKPQKALLVSPGFAEYEQALKTVNCHIRYYELSKERGFLLGEDYLESLQQDLDIVFLCNPNNPTGLLIPTELLKKIVDICKEKQIFLVLDECFLEFVSDELMNPQKKLLKEMPNLFILKAFTKMYGMPGLRLGYGLCSDIPLLEQMHQMTQPWNVSVPAQFAGAAACKEIDFVAKTKTYIAQEREYLSNELKRLKFTVYDSQANYIFFEAPKNLWDLCEKENILIRDCSNYRGLTKGYYRIAIKTRQENEELIRVLLKYYG
ncbi:MAG: aminotransferase class I/II-fold pyridoxal phosphate-dependent enzyme [Lachnospiraceae bacterium]|nr:aminotransferase class I/II-fold pyridoxal phosphate-dependent enzyme [Lachnospiraceae bacterium]